jgi:hypothetical protein
MYPQEQVQVHLKDLFIVLALCIVGGFIFFGAIANEDPLWFLPFFDETPARIVVYREGCQINLAAGQPGFEELKSAINQSLSQVDGYEQGFGLSPDTIKQYTEKGLAIQVLYLKRIKIHVAYRFGSPDTLFIPLSDYFGDARAVFGGINRDYWTSALRLKTTEPIRRVVEQIHCSP